ncbi:MAG: hypothetical protein LUG88_01245 [Clostridia bacterium]|nr:hypothetical protein [Clostridia bacterium]
MTAWTKIIRAPCQRESRRESLTDATLHGASPDGLKFHPDEQKGVICR